MCKCGHEQDSHHFMSMYSQHSPFIADVFINDIFNTMDLLMLTSMKLAVTYYLTCLKQHNVV